MNLQVNAIRKARASVDVDAKCDICHGPLRKLAVFYDGKTTMGPWAWMCNGCFPRYGVGLGTGKGQEYNSATLEKIRGYACLEDLLLGLIIILWYFIYCVMLALTSH